MHDCETVRRRQSSSPLIAPLTLQTRTRAEQFLPRRRVVSRRYGARRAASLHINVTLKKLKCGKEIRCNQFVWQRLGGSFQPQLFNSLAVRALDACSRRASELSVGRFLKQPDSCGT